MLQAYTWVKVSLGEFSSKLRREDGGVAAEYALLVSLIAVVIVVGAFALGNAINDRLNTTAGCVSGAPTGAC